MDIDLKTQMAALTNCITAVQGIRYFDESQMKQMKDRLKQVEAAMGVIERSLATKSEINQSNIIDEDKLTKLQIEIDSRKPTVHSNKNIQKLIKSLKPSSRPEIEEDDIQEEVFNYVNKDPLTKKAIQHPVKNKVCGHVYDKETIREFITNLEKKRLLRQCPQSGCRNRKNLVMDDMMDFPEFFDLCKD